jgi:MFS family permease
MTLSNAANSFIPIKTFKKPARLYLIAIVITGFITSGWTLFFNLFILARKFDVEFLGLINAMPSVAALLLTIPLGMFSDRFGRRKSMLLGLSVVCLGYALQVLVPSKVGLVILAFIIGAGSSLFGISQAPFLMGVSNNDNRALLFSMNFGLQTLAGTLGNLFAGFLPDLFSKLYHVAADSSTAYQAVLLTCVILGSFALIPIFMIREGLIQKPSNNQPRARITKVFLRPMVWRLFLPNFVLGIGAAILIPYMNVFFRTKFNLPSNSLGVLFSLSAFLTGIGSIIGPRVARKLKSKIKTIVLTQGFSIGFLLLTGFAPLSWLAAIGFLLRTSLMNMANPLFSAFAMEQTPDHDRGSVNSLLNIAWTFGWAIGPYISGLVQKNYGFPPLFISTFILYCLSTSLVWIFFKRTESENQIGGANILVEQNLEHGD